MANLRTRGAICYNAIVLLTVTASSHAEEDDRSVHRRLGLERGPRIDELRKHVRDEFAAVNDRLDHIEFEVSGQDWRISNLEYQVRINSRKIGLDAGR